MNKLNSLLTPLSKDVFLRFPIVFFFIVFTFIFAVFENHSIYIFEEKVQERVFFYLGVSILFFTSMYLFLENKQTSKKDIIFCVVFSIVIFNYTLYGNLDSFIFLVFAGIVSLMISAFIHKNSNNKAIVEFNLNGMSNISFAFLSSCILALGVFAIVSSLNFLFSFSFFKDNLEDIYIFIITVVFPTLVLSHIPKDYKIYKQKIKLKKALIILIKNILTPLVLVYTLILYAYFIKIVFINELPKGEMSWIISVYFSLGIFLKIFLSLIEEKNFLLKIVDKYFIYSMLLPIVFLGFAIYVRIQEYGITEARYTIALLFLWFVCVFLYTILKKKFCIKTTFISLFTFLLIASISPFNASSISLKSQISRFEKVLIENEMLKDNQLFANKKELSIDTRAEISSLASYLTSTQSKKDTLNSHFDKEFKNRDEVLQYLNVKYARKSFKDKETSYLPVFNLRDVAIDTKDYDFVTSLNLGETKKNISYKEKTFDIELKENLILIDFKKSFFKIDLSEMLENLKEKKIENFNQNNYKDLLIVKEKDNLKIKLFIEYFSINKEDKITYIDAILLIKE